MSTVLSASGDDRMVPATELARYPAPVRTKTYTPVAHVAVVDLIVSRARLAKLVPLDDPRVLVTKKGERMFGVINYEHRDGRALAVGFRNSYDKSTSLGIAAGQTVLVCSNMCFSGRAATFARKHTGNAFLDFGDRVADALRSARSEAAIMDREFAKLADSYLTLDDGYGIIGRAVGHRIVTPTQANVALREWRSPSFCGQYERHGWRLYNAFTQGLKHGAVDMTDYARVHQFIMAEAA